MFDNYLLGSGVDAISSVIIVIKEGFIFIFTHS